MQESYHNWGYTISLTYQTSLYYYASMIEALPKRDTLLEFDVRGKRTIWGGPVDRSGRIMDKQAMIDRAVRAVDAADRVMTAVGLEWQLDVYVDAYNRELDGAVQPEWMGQPAAVILSQGLVDALSDDEIAAVIGHELAHIDLGHDLHPPSDLRKARMQEFAADIYGGVVAGFDAMASALQKISDATERCAYDSVEALTKTHPATADRVNTLREAAALTQ